MKMSPKMREELDGVISFLHKNDKNLSAIDRVAMHLQGKGFPLEEALKAYDRYLAEQPKSRNAAFNYAWYLTRDGQFEAAIGKYRRALELGIDRPEEVHLNIANIYMDHLRDNEKAREEFQRAIEINPRYAGAYQNLGNLAEQLGDREKAGAYFEKCLEINPGDPSALARLADAHRFLESDDPLLARLIANAERRGDSDLHFALGSAFNQLADYDRAWSHFSKANALDRKHIPPYDREQTESFFNRIASEYDREWFDRCQGSSSRPVLICGMFRTGSTLLEQVLAAHPSFTAVGESEFFPRLVLKEFHEFPEGSDEITSADLQLWRENHAAYSKEATGGSTRLIDKRPDNFLYIGLIKAILPSASFVVTQRDWRDVALSIYSTRLGAAQNYSTRLADIRHYIGQQEKLVDHWKSVLGDDLVRVRYEELVEEPRTIIGELLERLGEDWDERCLSFEKRESTVKTASVWQVRETFHSRSVGRWKNYRTHFEQAFDDGPDA